MPHPIRGISVDITPGAENPVVGDPMKVSRIKPRRVHFQGSAMGGSKGDTLWKFLASLSLKKERELPDSK
jgi:hypothetical protein